MPEQRNTAVPHRPRGRGLLLFLIGSLIVSWVAPASLQSIGLDTATVAHAAGSRQTIAVGRDHACAIAPSRRVQCWGSNGFGQLAPVTVAGYVNVPQYVGGLDDAVSIDASWWTTCAVLANGTVSCWGPSPDLIAVTPVAGVSDATSVTVGLDFGCAVVADGAVSCWGDNTHGQLGDGTTVSRPHAALVSGLSGITSLTATGHRVCALDGGGRVACWGDNDLNPVDRGVPGSPVGVAAGSAQCFLQHAGTVTCNSYFAQGVPQWVTPALTRPAVGLGQACALLDDGTVECWSPGSMGHLADGEFIGLLPAPVGVRGVSDGVEIDSEGRHSCVRTSTGGVTCWGMPFDASATRVPGVGAVSAVSLASNSMCVVSNDTVVLCQAPDTIPRLGTARIVEDVSGPSAIANGSDGDGCALMSAGEVRCWFGNTAEVAFASTTVNLPESATAIGVTEAGTKCALVVSGSVWCWGDNPTAFGAGAPVSQTNPVRVSGQLIARSIAIASEGVCMGVVDGTVHCVGIGRPLAQIPGMSDVEILAGRTSLDGSWYPFCAASSATTWCWTLTRNDPPSEMSLPRGIRQLALGSSHWCALLGTDRLACGGDDREGQTGSGTANAFNGTFQLMDLPLVGATTVTASNNSTCAVVEAQLWCWGSRNPRFDSYAGVSVNGLEQPVPPPCANGLRGDTNCDGRVRVAILGDSYISGEGAYAYRTNTEAWVNGVHVGLNNCHRSAASWAFEVARVLTGGNTGNAGFGNSTPTGDLLFAACSGATTADLDRPNPNGFMEHQLQQLAAFNAQRAVDIVLVSVGGNDARFSDVVTDCIATACTSAQWRQARLAGLEVVERNVRSALIKIRNAAPAAAVYHANYPDPLLPTPQPACQALGLTVTQQLLISALGRPWAAIATVSQGGFRIAADEQAWLSSTFIPSLNRSLTRARSSTGVYALPNLRTMFADHGICSADPWVWGLTPGEEILAVGQTGIIGAESFHPNPRGHEQIAATFLANSALFRQPVTAPVGAAAFAEPFLTATLTTLGVIGWNGNATARLRSGPPDTRIIWSLNSLPQFIADGTTDSAGNLDVGFVIPAGTPAGIHTARAYTADGALLTTQFVAVRPPDDCAASGTADDADRDAIANACDPYPNDGPDGDYDGDGSSNAIDLCPTIADLQYDADDNGVGDACDPGLGFNEVDAMRDLPVRYRGAPIVSVTPARLLETRSGPGLDTIDGQQEATGKITAGSRYALAVAGRGGVSADASSVFLNITAVSPDAPGYITVWPCGDVQPTASSLNFRAGVVIPNAVLAQVGSGGTVCLYSSATVDVVVDVNGYVPAGGTPTAVNPARLLETRSGTGLTTTDGRNQGTGRIPADTHIELPVAARGGSPANPTAVMLNVTAIFPDAPGYITVWPCGEPRPTASNLNYAPATVIPNAVLAKVGVNGNICIYTSAPTDLVVDLNGYVSA